MKIYNKLVRDKIPTIIQDAGKECVCHVANKEEYRTKLGEKLHEEATEFAEDPCLDEAADVITVFLALLQEHELDLADVVFRAIEKEEVRGVFESKIILESVEE